MSKVDHHNRSDARYLDSNHSWENHEQIAAYEKLAPIVRGEHGCLQYDLHAFVGDDDRFVLIERWAVCRRADFLPNVRHQMQAGRLYAKRPASLTSVSIGS